MNVIGKRTKTDAVNGYGLKYTAQVAVTRNVIGTFKSKLDN